MKISRSAASRTGAKLLGAVSLAHLPLEASLFAETPDLREPPKLISTHSWSQTIDYGSKPANEEIVMIGLCTPSARKTRYLNLFPTVDNRGDMN